MLKKIGTLFLVILLCLGCMTSCFSSGNKSDKGNSTEGPEATEAPAVTEKLPEQTDVLEPGRLQAEKNLEELFADKDYSGLSFSIVIAEDSGLDLDSDEELSYSRALELQSDIIAKKLNCTIYVNRTSYGTFLSDAQAAKNAGLFYADLVCVPQKSIGYMRSQGLICELNSLYGDIFNEECYDLSAKQQSSSRNLLYGIAGKGTVTPGAYGCVYFNKTIANELGITEQLYSMVKDGTWTVDALLGYKDAVLNYIPAKPEVDPDAEETEEGSEEGSEEGESEETEETQPVADSSLIGADSGTTIVESLFGASGMYYVTTSPETQPVIAQNGERFDRFVAKMKEFFSVPRLCRYDEDVYDVFEQGKLLFYVDTLEMASSLSVDYGILPLPKFDSEQENYSTFTNENAYMYCVLTTNNRPQYAADLIRAFNETADIINDAWARDMLDYTLRDENSYHNVRTIFDNAHYDFAYMYGDHYDSVAESTYRALCEAVFTEANYNYYVGLQTWRFRSDMFALFP